MKNKILLVVCATLCALTVFAQDYKANRLNCVRSDDGYDSTRFHYDAQDRMAYCEYTTFGYSGKINYIDSLFYDANGNVIKLSAYQLVKGAWFHGSYIEYTYDENNNRLTRTNYNNFGDGMVIQGVYTYVYNEQNKCVSHSMTLGGKPFERAVYSYDANGNLSSIVAENDYSSYGGDGWENSFKTDYTYDANNRMIKQTSSSWDADLMAWQLNTREEWTYDANGNCIKKEQFAGNELVDRRVYAYDKNELIADYILPENPEPVYGEFQEMYNKPTYYEWYTVDDNNVLQYVTNFWYIFGTPTDVETVKSSDMMIYPNPASNMFVVRGDNKLASVDVYDVTGHLVKTVRGEGDVQVTCSDLANGTYLVRVFDGSEFTTQQVIVNK